MRCVIATILGHLICCLSYRVPLELTATILQGPSRHASYQVIGASVLACLMASSKAHDG
jgi:hypothetical protein